MGKGSVIAAGLGGIVLALAFCFTDAGHGFMAGLRGDARPGADASSEADCVERYATKSGAPRAAAFGYGLCRQLFDPASTPEQRARAECILPLLPELQNDDALRVAVANCDRAAPSAAAPPPEPAAASGPWDDYASAQPVVANAAAASTQASPDAVEIAGAIDRATDEQARANREAEWQQRKRQLRED